MAHFYGRVKGQAKTAVTRLGSKKSGLNVSANGWSSGITVYTCYNNKENRDEHFVYATHGSGNGNFDRLITKVYKKDGKIVAKNFK